jgi:guanylate kinase
MQDKGHLIIIAAPSGTGKTSVIRRLLSLHPEMIHSISWTTRPVRPDKTDERDYHFVDQKTFSDAVENGMFAEFAEVHNHMYGTPKEPLEQALQQKKNILLDLDVMGSLALKKMYENQAISIFLLPPSVEELKNRLRGRKTDSPEEQEIRLKNAIAEITYRDKFDYQVVNDDLDQAVARIEKILFRF